MVLGELDSYTQKNETRAPTYARHQNKFKRDKGFNTSPNNIKVLEENIGRKISDIPCSNILTDTSPKARDIEERINKWDLIKIKSFCMAKENSIKIQREPTVWENIFANVSSDKSLISKMYKKLNDCTAGIQITQLKMVKGLKQTLLQGRHTEGPETYEKMLCITSHQRDAN